MTSTPPPHRDYLVPIRRLLDRIAPYLKPALITMTIVLVVVTAVFCVVLISHAKFARSSINWEATEAVGSFLGGILGPLLSAISSILLVITLIYTAHEYELSRQELKASVDAQVKMANAQNRQEEELKKQTEIARQESHLNMTLRAIHDLRLEVRDLNSVLGQGFHHFINAAYNRYRNDSRSPSYDEDDVMKALSEPMVKAFVLISRAKKIWDDIPTLDIHPSQVLRCKLELLSFVKDQMAKRETIDVINEIYLDITQWLGMRAVDESFRAFGRDHLNKTLETLLFFFNMSLLKVPND